MLRSRSNGWMDGSGSSSKGMECKYRGPDKRCDITCSDGNSRIACCPRRRQIPSLMSEGMETAGDHEPEVPADGQGPAWWRRLLVGNSLKRTALRAAVLTVVCLLLFGFVLLPVRVTGQSMEPTYRNGSVNIVNRLSYLWSEPRRGDVVAIEFTGRSVQLLKRIVGLPGERVAIREGWVTIDGKRLDEPYTEANPAWHSRSEMVLEPGEYFVVGDNRGMPMSQHEFGAVTRRRIVGKVLF